MQFLNSYFSLVEGKSPSNHHLQCLNPIKSQFFMGKSQFLVDQKVCDAMFFFALTCWHVACPSGSTIHWGLLEQPKEPRPGKFRPIGSMVLLYMVTWIPSIYPLYVSIYTSTMDPMGDGIFFGMRDFGKVKGSPKAKDRGRIANNS